MLQPSDDDDEWEWEYDDVETEDYYVTLDLSAVVTAIQSTATIQGLTNDETLETASPQSNDEEEIPQELDPQLYSHRQKGGHSGSGGLQQSTGEDSSKSTRGQNDLQILDLHSSNPIISYGGKLLSCHWALSFGTDMFFSSSRTSSDLNHVALRSITPDFDLVGAGSARLVAASADFVPRKLVNTTEGALPTQWRSDNDNEGSPVKPHRKPVQVPLRDSATVHERNQANFLERLDAIKVQRGDSDSVHIGRGFRPKLNVSRPIWASAIAKAGGTALAVEAAPLNVDERIAEEETEENQEEEIMATPEDEPETHIQGFVNIPRRQRPNRRSKASLFRDHEQYRQELQDALLGKPPAKNVRSEPAKSKSAQKRAETGDMDVDEDDDIGVAGNDTIYESEDVEMEEAGTA